jgi:hypothetical protein
MSFKDRIRRIEAAQHRIAKARAQVRWIMQRQQERIEENRRVIEWAMPYTDKR